MAAVTTPTFSLEASNPNMKEDFANLPDSMTKLSHNLESHSVRRHLNSTEPNLSFVFHQPRMHRHLLPRVHSEESRDHVDATHVDMPRTPTPRSRWSRTTQLSDRAMPIYSHAGNWAAAVGFLRARTSHFTTQPGPFMALTTRRHRVPTAVYNQFHNSATSFTNTTFPDRIPVAMSPIWSRYPITPLQPTSLRSPHHSQTTTRLRPTSPIHYIKEKTYNTTVENTILDNRRPSQKHQLPIHERDHQSDLKQRQPCGLGLNHPRGTRWRTHPHGRHRRRHLSIMCIDKTAFHLPTSETSAQAYTRPNQTCTLPSQTLANAQNYQPIAITGSDGSYFIDDAPATFLQHLHHKNCHSPILPVLSSPATSFTNLAELKYKTSHQSSSTHLDNLGHIRLYEHAQQCRVSHSHRMR